MEKNAIENVPVKERLEGFYSIFFLVPIKTGDLRPVINLKLLSNFLHRKHFKMDSLNGVLNLVQKGDWVISLDLKDAYFHVPFHKTHKKFLRFCVNNQCYQFRVLCFRANVSSPDFHKSVHSGSCTLESSKHPSSCLPRRLVCCKSKQTNVDRRSREDAQSSNKSRFHSKFGKVKFNPNTDK